MRLLPIRILAPFLAALLLVVACGDDDGGGDPDSLGPDTAGDTAASDTTAPDTGADTSADTAGDTSASDTSDTTAADLDDTADASDLDDTGADGVDTATDLDDTSDGTDTADDDLGDTADTADLTGLPDGPSSERQTPRPLGTTQAAQGYHEYLPPGYGDGAPRPLLVFFHGIGENGDGDSQLDDVLAAGPPRLISRDEWPSERPFVVLSPQHSGANCPSAAEIDAFLDYALATYDIDLTRVYLTGLSCGAIGVWNYLGTHTDEVVAAAVPIAGDGRGAWNRAGCDLGLVALWAFHGDDDGTVDVAGTQVPVANLLECPSPPRKEVLEIIYPGVGHDSWTRTYNLSAGHDPYTWLLGHTHAAP